MIKEECELNRAPLKAIPVRVATDHKGGNRFLFNPYDVPYIYYYILLHHGFNQVIHSFGVGINDRF